MLKIFKASAGSGKTYQLAREYITLLLGYYDSDSDTYKLYKNHPRARDTHKRILAITFTLKATEEMKKRIVERLYELSSGKKSDYLEGLMKLYSAPESEIRSAAGKALRDLLSRFSFFNVSTIDSFFQTILRAMAFELDQNGDFAVEINDEMVLSVAMQDLIWSLRSGYKVDEDKRKLRHRLEKYLLGNIDGKSEWGLFPANKSAGYSKNDYNSLGNLVKYINSEHFKLHSSDITNYFNDPQNLDRFKNDVNAQIGKIITLLLQVAKSLPQALKNAGIDESQISRINAHPWAAIYKAQKLSSIKEALANIDSISPNDTYYKNKDCPEKLFKTKTDLSHVSPVTNLLDDYLKLFLQYSFLAISIENLDALSLIYDVYSQMEKYREDNDTLLLSQTTEFLSKIVTADDAPFIYERMGVAPKHFLIDEFQDTSKMQWHILDPLLQNSLGDGNSSLIIGDVKQSIYRFRNADPSLLHSGIETDFKHHIDMREGSRMPEISINFRSRENIIKFNNTFFSLLADKFSSPLIKSSYSNVVQHVKKKNIGTGGYVTIDFIDKTEDTGADNAADSKFTPLLNKALQYAVEAIKRGYKPSQIAFLSRVNPDNEVTVNFLISHLEELMAANNGIPVSVVSDESLLLRNSPIVNSIIGMLQFISGEESVGEEFDINNRNLYLPLIAQFFHRKWAENGGDASHALSMAMDIPIPELRNTLIQSLDVQNGSLYGVIERIIDSFSAEVRDSEAAYLFAFQDIVIEYLNNNTATIPAFLKWWKNNNNKLSITTPPNENAINVMTIHKSKGLEYEIVIIPRCEWKILASDDLMWFDTDKVSNLFNSEFVPPVLPIRCTGNNSRIINSTNLNIQYNEEIDQSTADGLNLTYVAFTRARSELHIICGDKPLANTVGKYANDILHIDAEAYNHIYDRYTDLDAASHFLYLYESTSWGEPTYPLPPEEKDTKGDKEEEDIKIQQCLLDTYQVAISDAKLKYSADIIPPGPRGEGVRMHKIMEGIRDANDVKFSVRRCAARGFIEDSADNISEYTELFLGYISQPEPSQWFTPGLKVLREQWMHHDNKQRRADRIVIFPDNSAIVIDYKFGEEAENIYKRKEYLSQIKFYMSALKAIGYSNVIGKIWHPESGEIRTVTFNTRY